MVPRTLYLPDGRSVPVCVIEAPKEEVNEEGPPRSVYPVNNIGGGWPVIAEAQGRQLRGDDRVPGERRPYGLCA